MSINKINQDLSRIEGNILKEGRADCLAENAQYFKDNMNDFFCKHLRFFLLLHL